MKILNGTLYAVFILLLLGVAGLFLASLLPIPGNIQVKIVKSGSMEPAIKTGSVAIVKPEASYAVGDVITFGEDTGRQIPTTHRIVSIGGDFNHVFYMTKGDANEEADGAQIAAKDVIGKVVLTVPYAGYVLDFARQPVGFTLMIGVPAAIIILDEMARIWKEVQKMRMPVPTKNTRGAAALARRREEEEETPVSDVLSALGEQYRHGIRSMDGITPRWRQGI